MVKYIVTHGIRIATEFIPQTFGRLTTIGPVFYTGDYRKQVCSCACGEVKVAACSALRCGYTRSCGCLDREKRRQRNTKHGQSGTPTHSVWLGMLSRCSNPNVKSYKDYGGRGIKVCDRWLKPNGRGFLNFLADVGERPSPGHEIDRKNNSGNYEPGNCQWITKRSQANNRRTSRWIAYGEERLTLAQWAGRTGLRPETIAARLKKGWTIEQALTTPLRRQKPSQRK